MLGRVFDMMGKYICCHDKSSKLEKSISQFEKPPVDYVVHPEAVIISSYYNPQQCLFRKNAFKCFMSKIQHCNYKIIECVVGNQVADFQDLPNIKVVRTETLLWHKESLLNLLVSELPEQFHFVFWIDADVIFANPTWMLDGVAKLSTECKIVQLFDCYVQLNQDEMKPRGDYSDIKLQCEESADVSPLNRRAWRSFGSNFENKSPSWNSNDFDIHGHVGFAWGCRRDVWTEFGGLYDRALIGGGDHIFAHAAAGQIPHHCLLGSFVDPIDLMEIVEWSRKFHKVVNGALGHISGDLFRLWTGDVTHIERVKKIQELSPLMTRIVDKDSNGLYMTHDMEILGCCERAFYEWTPLCITCPVMDHEGKPVLTLAFDDIIAHCNNDDDDDEDIAVDIDEDEEDDIEGEDDFMDYLHKDRSSSLQLTLDFDSSASSDCGSASSTPSALSPGSIAMSVSSRTSSAASGGQDMRAMGGTTEYSSSSSSYPSLGMRPRLSIGPSTGYVPSSSSNRPRAGSAVSSGRPSSAVSTGRPSSSGRPSSAASAGRQSRGESRGYICDLPYD